MTVRNQKKLAGDLALVRQIDDADVDLPEGACDLIEAWLRGLHEGRPLSEQERAKARALLEYAQHHQEDD
jgi:hypothetical protein